MIIQLKVLMREQQPTPSWRNESVDGCTLSTAFRLRAKFAKNSVSQCFFLSVLIKMNTKSWNPQESGLEQTTIQTPSNPLRAFVKGRYGCPLVCLSTTAHYIQQRNRPLVPSRSAVKYAYCSKGGRLAVREGLLTD